MAFKRHNNAVYVRRLNCPLRISSKELTRPKVNTSLILVLSTHQHINKEFEIS